jgi:hypothetical protein
MDEQQPDILISSTKVEPAQLQHLVEAYFQDMVKIVVDVQRRVVGVGGELHADAEQLLLQDGSQQADLWGANYYPGQGPETCVEYTALINIRPSQGNRSMEIAEASVREMVREITFELIGQGGEPKP